MTGGGRGGGRHTSPRRNVTSAPTANQGSDVHPNVLRSQTIPNTIGELGLPTATARLRFRPRALVAVAGVIVAGVALALGLGRTP